MAGPSSETLREVRATRRELAALNADFDRLHKKGRSSGSNFGKSFKKAAIAGVKEFTKGAIGALGGHLMTKFLERGKKGGKAFGKSFKREAKTEMSSLGSGMKFNLGAMAVIGAAGLAAAALSQFKGAWDAATEQERLTISFNALSADGAGGARIFDDLRRSALRTGLDIQGMASSVQKFLALGFAEDDALELNRSLLDIAGAVGMTTAEAGLLGSALAQVKSKGVASMEELRQQIAEKGVPVFQVLAEKVGVTEAEIIKMVSSGKLGADVVIEAFQKLEGPLAKFRGGADRMGSTAGGLFKRISQELVDNLRVFGEAMLPEIKPLLQDALDYVKSMKDEATAFGEKLGDAIGTLRATMQALSFGEILQKAVLEMDIALHKALDAFARGIMTVYDLMQTDAVGDGLERAANRFRTAMLDSIAEVLYAMSDAAGRFGGGYEILANQVDAASMKNRVTGPSEKGPVDWLSLVSDTFARQESVFGGRIAMVEGALAPLDARIKAQRQQNLKDQATTTSAPSSGGTPATQAKQAPAPSGGVLGGGLANALSRIGGGPNTIIMKRQLDAIKGTQKAAEETSEKLDKVIANTNPRRQRGAPAFT